MCNNAILASAAGLHNITTIGSELWIYENPVLENIEALENITPESIVDLHIYFNPLLSECHIDPICQYLSNPSGIVEIYMNATGCNNPDEIMEACDVIPAVRELEPYGYFTIFPNPFTPETTIEYALQQPSVVQLSINNQFGGEIKSLKNEFQTVGEHRLKIDLCDLKPGIYFCTLKTNSGIQTKKIIKL